LFSGGKEKVEGSGDAEERIGRRGKEEIVLFFFSTYSSKEEKKEPQKEGVRE